ncbi:hypothetical protein HYS28_00675 [Candidatus Uhrbacteria bacterium]|nr:hypothetical protein [Candidatus Uhrbacteria bacterium]
MHIRPPVLPTDLATRYVVARTLVDLGYTLEEIALLFDRPTAEWIVTQHIGKPTVEIAPPRLYTVRFLRAIALSPQRGLHTEAERCLHEILEYALSLESMPAFIEGQRMAYASSASGADGLDTLLTALFGPRDADAALPEAGEIWAGFCDSFVQTFDAGEERVLPQRVGDLQRLVNGYIVAAYPQAVDVRMTPSTRKVVTNTLRRTVRDADAWTWIVLRYGTTGDTPMTDGAIAEMVGESPAHVRRMIAEAMTQVRDSSIDVTLICQLTGRDDYLARLRYARSYADREITYTT